MDSHPLTHNAKFGAEAHAVLRNSDVSSVDGTSRVRLPPHDGITLLRAAICLSVVFAHLQPGGAASWPPFLPFQPTAGWFVTHPRLGFESFFVLAGYFLAHSFRPGPGKAFSVSRFYLRRMARLLPPYWVVLLVSWAGGVLYAVRHHETMTWLPTGFLRQMLLMDNREVNDLVAPQLWFMAPLIQFYLGWGTIFWLARTALVRFGSKNAHAAAIRVMMVVAAVAFLISVYADVYLGGLDYTLLTNAHYLVLGCLIYWYGNAGVGVAWLVCALGLEVALGCAANQSRPVATVVTALLLVHGAGRSGANMPKPAWLMAVGRCSYSIYLTHMFVGWRVMNLFNALLGKRVDSWVTDAAGWVVAVIGCVLCGYAYHRLVERPFARWAGTIEYRRAADAPPRHAT